MRTATLLFCIAAALLVSSDASSSHMLPAMRIGLALGSSFLRRLAEMKEKIREDLDRQAPLWTHLLHQQRPFGQVPWPVLRLQGTLVHGGQGFALPWDQAPHIPPFAVIRPCRPGVLMPCLSTLPSADAFSQAAGLQAGRPFILPAAQLSHPGSVIPPSTAFPAVTLLEDLQDKTGSTTTGAYEGTVAATTPTAAVMLLADLQDKTGSTTTGAYESTVASTPTAAVTLLANLEDESGSIATDAYEGTVATPTAAVTPLANLEDKTGSTVTGADEGTVGTTAKTASTTTTTASTGTSLDDIGTRAAFATESSSATEHETTRVTPATTELTSYFPTAVGTGSSQPSTVPAEITSHWTIPAYFVGDNNILEEERQPPVFAKMLENDVSS